MSEMTAGLAYERRGEGQTVLLIHGFPLDRRVWAGQIAALAGHADVVAVDLRGFGESVGSFSPVATMEQHAADCDLLLERLGVERAHVVGLSMGGYVALAMAEIFGHRVASLVLMDTKAAADTDAGRAGRDAMAQRLLDGGRGALAAELAGGLLAKEATPQSRARVRTMAEGVAYETYLAALEGMKQRPDRTWVLEGFPGPVTVVSGADDALMPVADVAEPLAAAAGGAELVVIAGAGHLPPIERPEATTAALIEHLRRTG